MNKHRVASILRDLAAADEQRAALQRTLADALEDASSSVGAPAASRAAPPVGAAPERPAERPPRRRTALRVPPAPTGEPVSDLARRRAQVALRRQGVA